LNVSANAAGVIARVVANASKAIENLFTGLPSLSESVQSFPRPNIWLQAFKALDIPFKFTRELHPPSQKSAQMFTHMVPFLEFLRRRFPEESRDGDEQAANAVAAWLQRKNQRIHHCSC
jgi:hypothetical protein